MKELVLENLATSIVGVAIALLGIIIKWTRAYFLIAGYNTMSAEQKSKVNIRKVANVLRNWFIITGLIWIAIPILGGLIGLKEIRWIIVVVLHITILLTLVTRVHSNQKYIIK